MGKFGAYLEKIGSDLTTKFSLPISFNPEDQLKSPVASLIEHLGDLLNLDIETLTEIQGADLGGRQTTDLERKGPKGIGSETPLFDFAGIEVDEDDE